MKKLKTLGKTTFGKIKVGEIFAYDGCWEIYEKTDEDEIRVLADDWDIDFSFHGRIYIKEFCKYNEVYKLPLSVQRLWRTD